LILRLSRISKSLGSEVVLSDVSIELGLGEVLVVKGRSGVGKTTLAKIASLQMLPDRGGVEFMGYSVAGLGEAFRSRLRLMYIGYIDQNYTLLSRLTVYENVELPLLLLGVSKNERRKMVLETLNMLEIENLIHRYPWEISGGERQRVAIARALVKKPKLLVADEPLSNLDDITTQNVLRIFRHFTEEFNTAILLTTTDLTASYGIGREAVLDRGVLREEYKSGIH